MVDKVYKVDKHNKIAMVPAVAPSTVAAAQPASRRSAQMATEQLLNVRQTAGELGVHENTVRNLERRGELKAIRLPGSGIRRFRKDDVDRMQSEMRRAFAPDTPQPEQRRPKSRRRLTAADY
jgi:excisionase family DNA binding protein